MPNTKRTIEDILATEGTVLTPYEVFRILQHRVAETGLAPKKPLRPQMVYNYDRNGLIVKGYNIAARDGLAGRYSVEQAEAWTAKYIERNRTKWAATTVDCFVNVESTEVEGQLVLEI